MEKLHRLWLSKSPKWIPSPITAFLYIIKNSIKEWIFSDFVGWLRNMGVKVEWIEAWEPYADWIIGGILLIAFIVLTIIAGIDTKTKYQQRLVAWEVYDNLSKAFRSLMYASSMEERAKAHDDIGKERDKLPDKGLDKIINLHFALDTWNVEFLPDLTDDEAQSSLRVGLQATRNYMKSKYGQREYSQNNEKDKRKYLFKWEHFKELTKLLLALKNAKIKNKEEIFANIEMERNAIRDRGLDKKIKPMLAAIRERIECGTDIKPVINTGIDTLRDYMNKHYPMED